MAASLSLQKSIRTCKVDTSWADKTASERFLSSCDLVCPTWNGLDSYGRAVCQDSFKLEGTDNPGCRTPMDRINIENAHRPQYFEYVSLDGFGVHGKMYSNQTVAKNEIDGIVASTGKVGLDYNAIIEPRCRRC